MMKKKNILIVGVLTLTLVASSSAMAFADTTKSTSGEDASNRCGDAQDLRAELNLTDAQKTLLHEARAEDMKDALASLVKAGTIKQTEADAILADMPAEPAERGDGPFQSLTEPQQAALKAKIESLESKTADKDAATHAEREAIMKEAIAALVKEGVLTQAAADDLLADMPADRGERGERVDGPFQNLTESQRTALMDELQTLNASSLKELVKDGAITQAQADILSQMGMHKTGGPGKGDCGRP